jgi:hypothetical protein
MNGGNCSETYRNAGVALFRLCVVFLSYRSEASTPVGASSPVQPEMLKAPWEHDATDEDGGGYFYNTSTVKRLKGNHITVQSAGNLCGK